MTFAEESQNDDETDNETNNAGVTPSNEKQNPCLATQKGGTEKDDRENQAEASNCLQHSNTPEESGSDTENDEQINTQEQTDGETDTTRDRSCVGDSPAKRPRASSHNGTCLADGEQRDLEQGRALRSKASKNRATSQTTLTHAFRNTTSTKKTTTSAGTTGKTHAVEPGDKGQNQPQ